MKDKDNVLRLLDEVDNMIMIMNQSVERNMAMDPIDVRTRFANIRQKLATITDRVSGS